jgi:hypothetical protein
MRRDRLIWIGVILLVSTAAWLVSTRYVPRNTPERVPPPTIIPACRYDPNLFPNCETGCNGAPYTITDKPVQGSDKKDKTWYFCCPKGYGAPQVNQGATEGICVLN